MAVQNQNSLPTAEELYDQVMNVTGRLHNIENLILRVAQANPQQANQQQPLQPQVLSPYVMPLMAAPVYGYQFPVGIPVMPVVMQPTPQQVYDCIYQGLRQFLSDYLNRNPDLRRLIP